MNYEKKYKEALEKARQLCAYPTTKPFLSDLQDLFPELAENKAERIRKALLDAMNDYTPDSIIWDDIRAGEIAAWLEKQGEENKGNIGGISPNSEWSEEDEENFCSVYLDVKSARQNTVNSLSGELKEQEQKRMDEVISWLKSLKGRVLPKQEWSEEDEQHIDSLLKRLDALCRNKFERTRFAISEDRDWLKSLKERKGGKI